MSDEKLENIAPAGASTDVSTKEESFEALLRESDRKSERLTPGQKVKARIVSISGDFVYIDLGGKSEGIITLSELVDESGSPKVKVGEEIEAFFVTVENGVRRLTTLVRGYTASSLNALRDAFEAGVPVTGDVKREIKGGFEISVGGVRCFCPFSQIDLKGGREGGIFLGLTFPFKIVEYEEDGKNIIVSRRAILEQEKKEKIEKLKASLSEGMDVAGTVRSVQKFGAFVDLGGIDGLIPASELSWDRTVRPEDALAIGQNVTARILAIDWERNRLTLSLKALSLDPWSGVADRYQIDSKTSGTVTRLAHFGAFVMLEPGVEGLVHISNLGEGRRINHPKEVVEVGQLLDVYVLGVDMENRKISLSLQPKPKPQKIVLPEVGEVIDGVVEKIMPFGVFVKLPGGVTGLVPNSEMGTQQGSDHKRMFPAGAPMKVVVDDVDSGANKVRLSRKAVLDIEAKKEYEEYTDSAKKTQGPSGGLGSLGDILKAKLAEKNTAS